MRRFVVPIEWPYSKRRWGCRGAYPFLWSSSANGFRLILSVLHSAGFQQIITSQWRGLLVLVSSTSDLARLESWPQREGKWRRSAEAGSARDGSAYAVFVRSPALCSFCIECFADGVKLLS
jgi:hypothetical protein